MPLPNAVRIRRDGIEYTSRVDRTQYLMDELIRAALRDSGKLIRNRALNEVRKLRGLKRGKRPLKSFQIWVKKREGMLHVGIKHDTWYGVQEELGTSSQPRRAILTNATYDNISDIRRIQGVYLSAIEDENRALGLISEDDEGDDINESD